MRKMKKWMILLIILGIGELSLPSSAQKKTPDNGRLPVYPGATVRAESRNGTRTLELRNVSVRSAWASAYDSRDSLEQVLRFYQAVLRSRGAVIQCTGGGNTRADLSLNQKALARPESCEADQFAAHGIELKVREAKTQRMVVLQPTSAGTTFALVCVQE